MRRIGLSSGLALAVISLLAAAPASAYVLSGTPWPEGTIRYYSHGHPRSNAAVDAAASAWNRARVGTRFVRSGFLRADVIVSGGGSPCSGKATVGYSALVTSRLSVGRCNASRMQLTVAHEFGHVLGLGHERRRCALMNPASRPDGTRIRCRPRPLSYWLARPLRTDDIRGARAIRSRAPQASSIGRGGFESPTDGERSGVQRHRAVSAP